MFAIVSVCQYKCVIDRHSGTKYKKTHIIINRKINVEVYVYIWSGRKVGVDFIMRSHCK